MNLQSFTLASSGFSFAFPAAIPRRILTPFASLTSLSETKNSTKTKTHFSADILQISVVPHHFSPSISIHWNVFDFIPLAGASSTFFVCLGAGERASGCLTPRARVFRWLCIAYRTDFRRGRTGDKGHGGGRRFLNFFGSKHVNRHIVPDSRH